MTVVAPADRPKSVRNSCVIECICSVFVSVHLCIVCCLGVFVIRLRQISSLFSLKYCNYSHYNPVFIVRTVSDIFVLYNIKSQCTWKLTEYFKSFRPYRYHATNGCHKCRRHQFCHWDCAEDNVQRRRQQHVVRRDPRDPETVPDLQTTPNEYKGTGQSHTG